MGTDFQYFQSMLFTDRRTLEYVKDKSKSSQSIILYMLARLQKMFKYTNLPDSIPRQYLENYLLVNGHCIIAKDLRHPEDENIYAFVGAAGGEPDIYYRPTRYMVANPALRMSSQYYISTTDPDHEPDAVLIRNDTMWQGLYPMMARYASLIAENLLTIRTADVMLRVLALITAPDDSSRLAANQFLKDMEDGHLASVGENRFLDGIKMQNPPSNNGSYLTQFIELHQYLVGSFYNEVGLNANYNMKREALSESETGLNDDSLMPLCEDMLRCRQEDLARVNTMFGTSIQVDLDSSWLENEIERLLSLRQQASEASSQLVNTAPLEAGMGDVSIEGASKEGVSMEDAGGNMDDEDGELESKDDGGSKESGDKDESGDDDGSNEAGKLDPENTDKDENDGTGENSPEEQNGEEPGSDVSDEDGSEKLREVEVNVEVDVDVDTGKEEEKEEKEEEEDKEDKVEEEEKEEKEETEEKEDKEEKEEEKEKEGGKEDEKSED